MPLLNNQPEISPDGNPTGVVNAAPIAQTPPPPAPKADAPLPPAKVEAPKPEAKAEDDNIDFTLFQAVKNGTDPVPEKKPEGKVDAPGQIKTTPEAKPDAPKADSPTSDNDGRDYSEFNDEEKGLFKRMSNDAFNRLKPIYLDHRKLKTQLEEKNKELETAKKGLTTVPDSYYEHPQAYVLTPEFAQAQGDVMKAEQVFNHWSSQLEKVREGAKEIDMLGSDQNGNLVITGKLPADTSAETRLLTYFNFSQQQLMNAQANARALGRTHSERYQNAVNFVRDFESKSFGAFDDPASKPTLEPLVKSTIEGFPPTFRSSPLASLLAKSLITTTRLAALVQKLQGNGATSQAPNPATKNGPTAAEAAAEGGEGDKGKDKDSVTFDDFEKVKHGY